MISKTCMITGVKTIKKESKDAIREKIRQEILLAIKDGYTHFMTSLDGDTAYCFSEIILEFKKKYTITLEASLSYRARIQAKNNRFQELLLRCDIVGVQFEEYFIASRKMCTHFMIQTSKRVIIVFDESNSVADTLHYAQGFAKEVRLIEL